MIQVFMNENLLLLLKGKTAMDLIKPFSLHFWSFNVCLYVCLSTHWGISVCVCECVCAWCSMREHI